jgi:ATP-binding cassette subfamily B protein
MEMFTKILLMDKGKLIETGNHENLMKKNGKYAALIKKNYK